MLEATIRHWKTCAETRRRHRPDHATLSLARNPRPAQSHPARTAARDRPHRPLRPRSRDLRFMSALACSLQAPHALPSAETQAWQPRTFTLHSNCGTLILCKNQACHRGYYAECKPLMSCRQRRGANTQLPVEPGLPIQCCASEIVAERAAVLPRQPCESPGPSGIAQSHDPDHRPSPRRGLRRAEAGSGIACPIPPC